ncbi:ABC transporter ATP-binding protein [soil metagenome]
MIRVILDGLVKRLDRVAVVDEASLELRPGELTVVLGPSGAGKSILARLIAGLETLDSGEIYFDGRVVHKLPARERNVGLVFQEESLWPHLSVAENVAYGLRCRGIHRKDRRKRVAEALGMVRADSLAEKPPEELSALQRRRVAMARAMVHEPSLLVLDEPLGPIEARLRADLREDIRRAHSELELTTLVLTSDAREALALAGHLAIMDLGKIVQSGAPQDVYQRPIDAFVAQFLGPTNLLQGQVEGSDARGDVVVRTPIGRLVGRAATESAPPGEGTPVTIAIRPEALSLGPIHPSDANRIVATLERQVFLGETRQVHLRGPGDWPITALALQGPSRHLREGQSLTVAVPPDQVVVLTGRYAPARPLADVPG